MRGKGWLKTLKGYRLVVYHDVKMEREDEEGVSLEKGDVLGKGGKFVLLEGCAGLDA